MFGPRSLTATWWSETPKAQRVTLVVTGRAKGTHTYRVEFPNSAGTTSSSTLTVTVRR